MRNGSPSIFLPQLPPRKFGRRRASSTQGYGQCSRRVRYFNRAFASAVRPCFLMRPESRKVDDFLRGSDFFVGPPALGLKVVLPRVRAVFRSVVPEGAKSLIPIFEQQDFSATWFQRTAVRYEFLLIAVRPGAVRVVQVRNKFAFAPMRICACLLSACSRRCPPRRCCRCVAQ